MSKGRWEVAGASAVAKLTQHVEEDPPVAVVLRLLGGVDAEGDDERPPVRLHCQLPR